MYEDAQEIFDYLPIRRDTPENDYINHLWSSYSVLDGGEAVARPFAIMPFHLLFMMAVQYRVLRIAAAHKQASDLFFSGVGGRNKEQLLSGQRSVFDMALINERTMSEIFQLIGVDPVTIRKFKSLIDERNDNLAHAKGGMEQELEKKVDAYFGILESIQSNCLLMNHDEVIGWLSEIQVGDDMDQFLETRLVASYISPRDFGDVIGTLLESDRLGLDQWKQIVDKGLGLAYVPTIFKLQNIEATSSDQERRSASTDILHAYHEESGVISLDEAHDMGLI